MTVETSAFVGVNGDGVSIELALGGFNGEVGGLRSQRVQIRLNPLLDWICSMV